MRVPCLTVVNTKPEFYWLNFLETILSADLAACTSASIAYQYRRLLDKYAVETGMPAEFVQWQGHDFGTVSRGMSSYESALLSGMGHLLSLPVRIQSQPFDALEEYYGADAANELIGGSVAATEHSVMCSGSKDGELETFKG